MTEIKDLKELYTFASMCYKMICNNCWKPIDIQTYVVKDIDTYSVYTRLFDSFKKYRDTKTFSYDTDDGYLMKVYFQKNMYDEELYVNIYKDKNDVCIQISN